MISKLKFHVVRKDRSRHGGGVCIYTSHTLLAVNYLPQCNQELECVYKVNKTFSKNVQGCRDGSAKNHSN